MVSIQEVRLGLTAGFAAEKIIFTPSHHRAHHAKNPVYMDTNFGNLVPIWDRLLGSYQEARDDIPPNASTLLQQILTGEESVGASEFGARLESALDL